MKSLPLHRRFRWALFVSAAAAIVLAPSMSAQTVATQPPASSANSGQVVQLSPFEVVSSARDTYESNSTTSLNGLNTPMNKAPIDARILLH